jgi:hypothetical protein
LYLIFNCTYFLISAALVLGALCVSRHKKLVISRSVRHLGGKRGDSPVLRGAESLLLLETSSGGHLGRKRGDSPVLRGAESLLLLETGSGGHLFTFGMLRKA